MIISGKYWMLILVLLILTVSFSGCINYEDSINITKINKTSNNSYSVNGVSFNCPEKWHVETVNISGNSTLSAFPDYCIDSLLSVGVFHFTSFDPIFQVQIIPINEFSNYNGETYNSMNSSGLNNSNSKIMVNELLNYGNVIPDDIIIENTNFTSYNGVSTNDTLSEQEIIDIIRNGTDSLGNKVSKDTLTIDGKTAYNDVFILNSLIPPAVDKRFEQIVFLKNGKIYLILLQVQEWDYNKEKQNFDMIINSFKVQ